MPLHFLIKGLYFWKYSYVKEAIMFDRVKGLYEGVQAMRERRAAIKLFSGLSDEIGRAHV